MQCPEQLVIDDKGAAPERVDQLIEDIENQVRKLAGQYRQSFAGRCATISECECTNDMCSDDVGDSPCQRIGGVGRLDYCAASTCEGIQVNTEESVVHWAGEGALTSSQKEVICGTKNLDSTFTEIYNDVPGLLYAYVGTYNGVIRNYPGQVWECGIGYDPRTRPWYRAASSGPKDIVIVIDKSGTMTLGDPRARSELVTEALVGTKDGTQDGLIDMLSQIDHVAVVTFSSDASVIGKGQNPAEILVRADEENKEMLKEGVEGIDWTGRTNFEAAFEKAFEVLENSFDQEITSSCRKVIVFLTDGDDSECECTDASVACDCKEQHLARIDAWQDSLETLTGERAAIFTYNMGSDALDNTLPRQIACRNSGSWAQINDGDDPLVQMSGFFSFLAKSAPDGKVFWSAPYDDWSTSTRLVSATSPVFENNVHRNLIGVVAVDVPPSVLVNSYNYDEDTANNLVQKLQTQSRTCSELVTTSCELQLMRFRTRNNEQDTCPADVRAVETCCFSGQATRVFAVIDEPRNFADARTFCETNITGGSLAKLLTEAGEADQTENMHLLAGMAPPDGAWVDVVKTGGAWASEGVALGDDNLVWAPGQPVDDLDMTVAHISPAGTMGNLKAAEASEVRSFICELPAGGACSADWCSRADPTATHDHTAAADPVETKVTCENKEEAFVRECGTNDADGVRANCKPASSRAWSSRKSLLCCGDKDAPAGGGGDGDGDDDEGGGAAIGGIVGGVVGGLVAVVVIGVILKMTVCKAKAPPAHWDQNPGTNPNAGNPLPQPQATAPNIAPIHGYNNEPPPPAYSSQPPPYAP